LRPVKLDITQLVENALRDFGVLEASSNCR
jgi:hypothetical protein